MHILFRLSGSASLLTGAVLSCLYLSTCAHAAGGILNGITSTVQGPVCNMNGNQGTPVCGAPSSPTTVQNARTNHGGGNPINLLTGNKFEQTTDLDSTGNDYALRLNRYYNSKSKQSGLFGYGWRSDYEMQLQDLGDNIDILQADGRLLHFKKTLNPLEGNLVTLRYIASQPELGYIERRDITTNTQVSTRWVWYLPEGKTFEFKAYTSGNAVNSEGKYRYGQLLKVVESRDDVHSPYWSLTYDVDDKLVQVSNHLGDKLLFDHTTTKYNLPKLTVTRVRGDEPKHKATVQYFLDKQGNLSQVVGAFGERLGYEYKDANDAHNLTAKYRYDNGKPALISQWAYDAYDRAISSSRAHDVQKISVAYDPKTVLPLQDADTVFTNRITNSVGDVTEYRYRYTSDDTQLLSVMGAGCATCGPTNISYEYDDAGRVIKVNQLDDTGRVLSWMATAYDDMGRVVTETYSTHFPTKSELDTLHFEYVSDNPQDERSQQIARVWRDSIFQGKQTGVSYTYNNQGQIIESKEFGYTPTGKHISRTHIYTYDKQGQLAKVALRDDTKVQPSVIALGAYTWYANGSIKTTQDLQLGITTHLKHNAEGLTTRIIKEQGDDTLEFGIKYDNHNRPIALKRYSNGKLTDGVKYQHNTAGDITQVADLNGNFIASYAYDDADRLLGELTKQGASFKHLDTEGRTLVDYNITSQQFNKLSYQYDAKSRITAAGRDDTQLLSVQYSPDGNMAYITGASGQQTLVYQDATQQGTQESANHWDGLQDKRTRVTKIKPHITRIEQSDNLITDYGFDDFGRLSFIDSQTAGRRIYHYNAQDQLTQIVLPNGEHITYTYNNQGNKSSKTLKKDNRIINQTNWLYDKSGQPLQIKSTHQTTQYLYDKQGRVIRKSLLLSGLNKPLTTHYQYDQQGKLNKITLPDGITFTHDAQSIYYQYPHQIAANTLLKQNRYQTGDNASINYQLGDHLGFAHYYDDQGRFTGLSYRSLIKTQDNPFIRSANADLNLPLFSQHWERDTAGIVEQVTETDHTFKPQEYNYLYDNQYHLVSSTYQPVPLSPDLTPIADKDISNNQQTQTNYLYDELGNRLLKQEANRPLTRYRYDEQGRLISIAKADKTAEPIRISYNKAGQPTKYGNLQTTYQGGQLTQIKDEQGNLIAEYSYNHLGQRVKKTVYATTNSQDNSAQSSLSTTPTTTYYVYEGSQLQHELDGAGNIIRHYVYIGDTLTATIDYPSHAHGKVLEETQDGVSLWARTSNWMSSLVSHDKAYPVINYVITDYLGRPRQVRDGENNALKWQFESSLFGGKVDKALVKESNYMLNVRFPGQYEDEETGLYYNHWRYYDQNTGRYVSADPLGLAGGENLYAYVNATPTHFIDPPGLLLFAFDGTNNQDYKNLGFFEGMGKDEYGTPHVSPSNVVKLRDLYRRDPFEPNFYQSDKKWKFANIAGDKVEFKEQQRSFSDGNLANNVFYISGAGTTDQYTGVSADLKSGGNKLDLGHGLSMVKRVDAAIGYLYDYLDHVYKDPNIIKRDEKGFVTSKYTINLDIVGFSRGAASARMFASKVTTIMNTGIWQTYDQRVNGDIHSPGQMEWKYKTSFLRNCGIDFNFNFMGLMDTVPAYGSNQHNDMADLRQFGMDLTVDSTFKSVVHAVAMNENRYQFSRRSIYENTTEAEQKNGKKQENGNFRLEKGFLGAHSDIGGGYQEGDLSNASLMWIIKQAKEAGIAFDDNKIIAENYESVNNPVVHDSVARFRVFTPGSEFLWATDGDMNYDKFSIFNSPEHLELLWEDTKQFENPKFKRFEETKRLTEDFRSTGKAFKEGNLIGMHTTHLLQFNTKMKKYKELKEEGKSGGMDILINTDIDDKIIRIRDYMDWLNCHYGLTLETNVTKDPSLSNIINDKGECI